MANMNQSFDITGSISQHQQEGIQKAVLSLEGVNQVECNAPARKVTVGYTPGLVTIQRIKEIIESQGVDVSDKGDD